MEATSLPRAFGVRHIGSIRGLVASVNVAGTAAGPLLFAVVLERTGSYAPALVGSAIAPVLVAVWALVTREPQPPGDPAAPDPATPSARTA